MEITKRGRKETTL